MKIIKLQFVLIFFLLGLYLSLGSKEAYAVAFTRSVVLQNAQPNSVEMRWATDTGGSVTINYGLSIGYGSSVQSNSVAGGSNNHATITGLSPNTRYYYQMISGGTPLTPAGSANHYFKTPPPVGSTTPFTWAIWGDNGSSGNVNVPPLTAKKPDLILVAGDVGYPYSTDFNNNNTQYFNVYKSIMSYTPFYATCGNHEASCATLVSDHSLPAAGSASGVESTYSWDYGNVHFVALNTNQNILFDKANPQNSAPQIKWAYNDLNASPQPWKILFFHFNGWSSGSHADLANQINNLYPLAQATGVDLVIWGHSHVYERWTASSHSGPAFFTIGNGGKNSTTTCTSHNPPCLAHSNGEAGFLYAQVNGNQMTVNYVTQSGTTADSVIYSSGPGGPTIPFSSPTQPPFRSPTPITATNPIQPTRTPTPISGSCSRKSQGDADCNGIIDLIDYEIWRREFTGTASTRNADYNADGFVNLIDYEIWRRPFTGGTTNPTNPPASPTIQTPPPTPPTGELSIAVCDRANGPFSLNINNPYFPLPVGLVHVLEGGGFKVQFSVLNQTKVIGGVTTRVIEEREWLNGNLFEVSYNWFVQAPNGTVCYYGEDVFDGSGNKIGGSWIAYDDLNNPNFRPGILMPGSPAVGQTYYQEVAPPVAQDRGNNVRFEPSYTTPAGTFNNVLYVEETPPSYKRYAPGIGLIYDDGALLTRL